MFVYILNVQGQVIYTNQQTENEIEYLPFIVIQQILFTELNNQLKSIENEGMTIVFQKIGELWFILKRKEPLFANCEALMLRFIFMIYSYLVFQFGSSVDTDLVASTSLNQLLNPMMNTFQRMHHHSHFVLQTVEFLQISEEFRDSCADILRRGTIQISTKYGNMFKSFKAENSPSIVHVLLFVGCKLVAGYSPFTDPNSSSHHLQSQDVFMIVWWLKNRMIHHQEGEHLESFTFQDYHNGILNHLKLALYTCIVESPLKLVIIMSESNTNLEFGRNLCNLLKGPTNTHNENHLQLAPLAGFLACKDVTHLSMIPFIASYPGLVHFILTDRQFGVCISPCLESKSTSTSKVSSTYNHHELCQEIEFLNYESMDKLRKGYTSIYLKSNRTNLLLVYNLWILDPQSGHLSHPTENILEMVQNASKLEPNLYIPMNNEEEDDYFSNPWLFYNSFMQQSNRKLKLNPQSFTSDYEFKNSFSKTYNVMGSLMSPDSIQGRCIELMTIWTGSVPVPLVFSMNRKLVLQLLHDPR